MEQTNALDRYTLDLGAVPVSFSCRPGSESDRAVFHQIFVNRGYDVTAWKQGQALRALYDLETAAGREAIIVDAGANIGASVVYFAASYPDALVYAIEPDPGNAALMRINCSDYNVEFLQGAIGREDGTAYLSDPQRGEWAYRVGETGDRQIRVFSAARIVEEARSSRRFPFIFKIDIEGGEAELFEAHTEWTDLFPLIVIELHDWLFPFEGRSRNFMKTIASYDFEIVQKGENLFCFNRRLLMSTAA